MLRHFIDPQNKELVSYSEFQKQFQKLNLQLDSTQLSSFSESFLVQANLMNFKEFLEEIDRGEELDLLEETLKEEFQKHQNNQKKISLAQCYQIVYCFGGYLSKELFLQSSKECSKESEFLQIGEFRMIALKLLSKQLPIAHCLWELRLRANE